MENRLIRGDSLRVLPTLPADSIDLIVTDPPYGLTFMGKDWDKAVPPKTIWQECLRVLKPGAFAFIMCSPRQDCLARMVVNLQDAGFETGFTSLYWTYASGFPKANRINHSPKFCQCAVVGHNDENKTPLLLKDAHSDMEGTLEYNAHSLSGEQHWKDKLSNSQADYQKECGLCDEQFPLSSKADLVSSPQQGYVQEHTRSPLPDDAQASESLHTPYQVQYSGPPSNQDYSPLSQVHSDILRDREMSKEQLADVSIRKDTDKQKSHKQHSASQSFPLKSPPDKHSTLGFPHCQICGKPIANGSYAGFQPKPAVEVILVAMKPLSEKTYVGQALANGKGITWLGDGRIPYKNQEDRENATPQGKVIRQNFAPGEGLKGVETNRPLLIGRFPANLLVSDDILNDGKNTKDGGIGGRGKHTRGEGYGFKATGRKDDKEPEGQGSYSRYFSLDSWWEERIKELPEAVQKIFPFLRVPKASKSERERGLEDYPQKLAGGPSSRQDGSLDGGIVYASNYHPTVKPLALMSYLITLGSRPGDIVLDPFMGSGTTCLATKILGRKAIGIEKEKAYFDIAVGRCKNVKMD